MIARIRIALARLRLALARALWPEGFAPAGKHLHRDPPKRGEYRCLRHPKTATPPTAAQLVALDDLVTKTAPTP